eukprot:CAMPEP_0206258704 /NCGR_PEP_ID=MMETSP0047_2-20121206/26075_1 /ASSEMBLY_ACC=CAM_ASM_000192 /TAXON_ID=195065 /ORGANISM="Chroomonas mesostigmatica_cf, Strain CCMP1168" /LENGTH=66 /DNA_ID=CAMNT_0053685493 /DNA_START=1 /DNA_END=197 /DNA_ORIENTATION=-
MSVTPTPPAWRTPLFWMKGVWGFDSSVYKLTARASTQDSSEGGTRPRLKVEGPPRWPPGQKNPLAL